MGDKVHSASPISINNSTRTLVLCFVCHLRCPLQLSSLFTRYEVLPVSSAFASKMADVSLRHICAKDLSILLWMTPKSNLFYVLIQHRKRFFIPDKKVRSPCRKEPHRRALKISQSYLILKSITLGHFGQKANFLTTTESKSHAFSPAKLRQANCCIDLNHA